MKLFKCNKSETLRQVLNISSFLQKEADIEKIIYEKNKWFAKKIIEIANLSRIISSGF